MPEVGNASPAAVITPAPPVAYVESVAVAVARGVVRFVKSKSCPVRFDPSA
jgi:hypothetical protein